MPRAPRAPKPVDDLPEPIQSPADALQRPQVAAAYAEASKQFDELTELLANADGRRAGPALTDALRRVDALRSLLSV